MSKKPRKIAQKKGVKIFFMLMGLILGMPGD
jgi:hypothetical protein